MEKNRNWNACAQQNLQDQGAHGEFFYVCAEWKWKKFKFNLKTPRPEDGGG